MNTKVEQSEAATGAADIAKYALAIALVAAGIFAFYWFGQWPGPVRGLVATAGVVAAAGVIRGLARSSASDLGNYWVDYVRMLWRVMLPLSFVVLVVNIALGEGTGWLGWALYCVSSTFITLSQPAVALAFVPALAGRALSAFNLVIFSGVFVVQWGIGLLVDAFQQAGWSVTGAFQAAFAVYLGCCVLSYLYFLAVKAEGHAPTPARQVAGQAR